MFWLVVERLGALVALVGLPYLVYDSRKRVARFDFRLDGGQRTSFEEDDGRITGKVTFSGSIYNTSLDPNSIARVFLVVWRTKRRRSTRRFGTGGQMFTPGGSELHLPLRFDGREGRAIEVRFDFPVSGSPDEALFEKTKPVRPDIPHIRLPVHQYELAFEDVAGNLFDTNGLPRSRRAIDLRWTLDNAWEAFKDGHPGALVRHVGRIVVEDVRFAFRRALRRVGL